MARRKTISTRLRQQIAERDQYRCGYCHSPQAIGVPMLVDHIVPLRSGGQTVFDNLALACYRCNEFKGGLESGVDPQTAITVPLFNPCAQEWNKHFEWSVDGARIVGKTAIGRATVEVLRMNNDWLVAARKIWMRAGIHPPLE